MDSFMDGQHDLLNNEPYNKEKTTTKLVRGHCGHDRMVVRFTPCTTCVINAYHH